MSPSARLIEDAGAASADPANFFRSPEFLRAEGVTHTLAVEGGPKLPVVVREIDSSDRRDAISPYGYPGGTGPTADPAEVDWSDTGLVSLFVRDRIGEPPALAGGTARSQVQIADPRGESGLRKRLGQQIRANERRGWQVAVAPGADAGEEAQGAFERAYAETMTRTDAAERYLYPSEYFSELLGSDRAWLLTAARGEADPLAGAIAVASDEHLHYYLGGTADDALEDSPMKNLFAAMIGLSGELGLPLNLGGGVSPGDSLESFKRGFANAEAPFITHEVICDRRAYEELSSARGVELGAPGYFPAYRA